MRDPTVEEPGSEVRRRRGRAAVPGVHLLDAEQIEDAEGEGPEQQDQPSCAKGNPDRLAEGRAAERQLAGDLRLVHALAWAQRAADDLLAEVARDLHRQRRRLLEVAATGHCPA